MKKWLNIIQQICVITWMIMAILFSVKGFYLNGSYCVLWAILTELQIKKDVTIIESTLTKG